MRLLQAILIVLWSLLALGAWALLAGPGEGLIGWLAGQIGGQLNDPQAAGWAEWLLQIAQTLGYGLIVVVWLVGIVALLVFGGLARRVLRR
jgi:hypothetical protein